MTISDRDACISVSKTHNNNKTKPRFTFNVRVERTSRDVRSSVLDGDEVVSGGEWRVAELIAFIHLATDQLHPRRTADVDRQRTGPGLGRVHDELAQFTCITHINVSARCTTDNIRTTFQDMEDAGRTSEALVESVSVRRDTTSIGVQTTNLDWIRTSRDVDAVQFDVDVMQTTLTWDEVDCIAV